MLVRTAIDFPWRLLKFLIIIRIFLISGLQKAFTFFANFLKGKTEKHKNKI